MRSIKSRKMTLFLTAVLCVGMISGCSGKMTPKKVMKQMEKNLAEVTSFSNQVEMDIKMEEVVHYTKVTMDMSMENTMDPKAGHAKGTAEVMMGGINLNSEMEIYQIMEDGNQVTYSGMDGLWVKETAEKNAGGIALDKSLFSEIGNSAGDFRIAKQAVEVGGKPCYEMYGDVTGEELIGILGSQMVHGFGLVELPDDRAVAELKIPVIFDVYQEEMLPARIIVDMTEVLNDLYNTLGEVTDVNHYEIELLFTEYDQVGEIKVPQSVKDEALTGEATE